MSPKPVAVRWLGAITAVLVVAMAGTAVAENLVPISGLSPYPDGGDPNDPLAVTQCNGGPQTGVLWRNCETEPYIAVNPVNHDNMIACWHQDRWSNGSAQGVAGAYTMDGGSTWTPFQIPFTRCSGGAPGTTGDYQRASDPWLTFSPDGTCHYMALVSDHSTSRNAMATAISHDGGQTWSDPIIIKRHAARGVKSRSLFHDKNSMTADPHDPNLVYATWTLFRNGSLALLFSRSTDGGYTWSAARPVNKNEIVAKHVGTAARQGSQIVVLPDGTLINAFYRVLFDPRGGGSFVDIQEAVFRSRDQGKHWERLDTPVASMVPTGGFDVELNIPVRDAGQIPDIAVDRNSGDVYIVWQDGRLSPFGASNVFISKSSDGGDTWTEPVSVTDPLGGFGQSFLPSVSVNDAGVVGVMYYDFRNDIFGDAVLTTDVHLAELDSDLNVLAEHRLTETSFDMRQMCIARGYFPGDYVGLDVAGNDFVAAFTVANNLGLPVSFPPEPLAVDSHNRQDIVFARITPSPSLRAPGRSELAQPRVANGGVTPGYELKPNTPNPFNPTTVISFEMAIPATVSLRVFDVTGQLVRTLVNGEKLPAGEHDVRWDGLGDRGERVASGVYFYRFSAGAFMETRRMILLK